MTFVIARKFGERIIMLADTMITQPDKLKHDIIPGQLKAIVLSLSLSVAFAGHLATALDSVRACKLKIGQGGGLRDVLDILSAASASGCDFMVASHVNGPELFKIAGGSASASQDIHWIGNRDLIGAMKRQADILDEGHRNTLRMNPDMPDSRDNESNFTSAFTHLLLSGPQALKDVGGFAVNLLASPYGHCYQQHAGAYLPGPISIGGPPHPEALAPGGSRYGYNFLDSGYRGVGIAGAFIEDASVGYIYDPLECDAAIKMPNTTMQAVIDELNGRGMMSGGKPEAEC